MKLTSRLAFFRRAIRQTARESGRMVSIRGFVFQNKKKFKMAAACLNKVIQIKNNDGRYYTELATLYSSKLGIPDKAENVF